MTNERRLHIQSIIENWQDCACQPNIDHAMRETMDIALGYMIELLETCDALDEEVSALQKQIVNQYEELSEYNAALWSENDSLREELENEQLDNTHLLTKNTQLATQLRNAKESEEILLGELNGAEEDYKVQRKFILDLTDKLVEESVTAKAWQSSYTQSVNHIAELQEENAAYKAYIAALHGELQELRESN